ALHEHLHKTADRVLLGSDDRARALELSVDELVRSLFNFIQQALAVRLIRLTQVNRSQPAHTKLTHHSPRNLDRTFDVVRRSRSHRRKQYLLRRTTTQQQRNLILEILALLHKPIALRQ